MKWCQSNRIRAIVWELRKYCPVNPRETKTHLTKKLYVLSSKLAVWHKARKANQALVDLLGKIAKRKEATPAQIALAWLLAQKLWIVPIPGTTKLKRLGENIGAAAIKLTSEDRRDIDDAASKITVQGARYPKKLEQMTGR